MIANDIMLYIIDGITYSVIYNSTRKTKGKHHFYIITILLEGSEIGARFYFCFVGNPLSIVFFSLSKNMLLHFFFLNVCTLS